MKKTLISTLLLLFSCPLLAAAQEEEPASRCFPREELLRMIHLPFSGEHNTELMDILDSKGYQLGSDVEEISDTVMGIILRYRCNTYYDKVEGRLIPAVQICESLDGLKNIIKLNLNRQHTCSQSLTADFRDGGYLYDGRRSTYSGRDGSGNQEGIYEAFYAEDSLSMHLVMRLQSEIDQFVAQQRSSREAKVEAALTRADRLAEDYSFAQAYTVLEQSFGIYPPLDPELNAKRQELHEQQALYFYNNLIQSVNQRGDLTGGVAWCDSILSMDVNNDTVKSLKQILIDQRNGETHPFSQFSSKAYRQVLDSLQATINHEISSHRYPRRQTLQLHFRFNTFQDNQSQGSLVADMDLGFLESKSKLKARNELLKRTVDSIARMNCILPVVQHGINIKTDQEINANIEWIFSNRIIKGDPSSADADLKGAVDTIVNRYFRVFDEKTVEKSRLRMPWGREYTFGVTKKRMGDSVYTDISLLDFKTSDALSWAPSLIIPGTGTKLQGSRSSVLSRAIPFFLFGALSVTGFMWEKKAADQGIERPDWSDGETAKFWEYKNFGYILGYGGAVIAGSIYITDLVQSIQATIQNLSRSKKLRKELKKVKQLDIQMQDIYLQ